MDALRSVRSKWESEGEGRREERLLVVLGFVEDDRRLGELYGLIISNLDGTEVHRHFSPADRVRSFDLKFTFNGCALAISA
jgi:hypothetical protein